MLLSRCASSLLPVFAVAGKFWRTLQTWLIVSLSINLPGVALGMDREPAADTFARAARTFLEAYCFECHGHGASEADVDLQQLTTRPHDRSIRDTRREVMQQLRAGTMPPPDHAPRPAVRLSARFVERIDKRFFHVDCDQVHDPGRVTIRRLNQTEYENTIRDLLGVPFTAAETFPRDGVGYGFDNIGDVLSLPPALLEKYLAAAATISRDVVYTGEEADLRRRRYSAAALKATPNAGAALENDYLLLNREGGAAYATFHPYIAGDYLLRVRAFGVQPSGGPMRMARRVADETVSDVEIEGHRRHHDF